MKTTAPKTRNARAPRKTAKAAAEKSVKVEICQCGQPAWADHTGHAFTPFGDDSHRDKEPHRQDLVAVLSTPPVHQRWTGMVALLAKGEDVELTPERREAWEWFRSKSDSPKVNMTNRTVGVIWIGNILFEQGNLLKSVKKGGRKPH